MVLQFFWKKSYKGHLWYIFKMQRISMRTGKGTITQEKDTDQTVHMAPESIHHPDSSVLSCPSCFTLFCKDLKHQNDKFAKIYFKKTELKDPLHRYSSIQRFSVVKVVLQTFSCQTWGPTQVLLRDEAII